MRVHPVELDLPLSEEGLVDLLLIQWRTPIPDEEGITPAVLTQSAEHKHRVLERLCAWIVHEQRESSRPLFVLAPEISTPLDALGRFEALLEQVNRPVVVVVGTEYLDPPRYCDLVSGSCNPELEGWIQGVDACEKVNAAIILTRSVDGTVGKYVQPKIRPADPERTWRVYGAEHVLLFHHRSHAPGAGLNFCVQICSDFCSATYVSLLRNEIAGCFPNEDLRLDLTLLLQCNRDQAAPQFRDGTNAYFGGPHQRKVRTDAGALLMLNNASRMGGESGHWGGSQFRFLYNSWKQPGGEFTYWLAQVSGEEWQAAAFRYSASSVYWVTYKPPYLCDHRPSEDSQPFGEASCWSIPDDGDCVPSFRAVSAAIHWLEGEWMTAAGRLVQSLVDQGVNQQVAEVLHNTYLESMSEWIAALEHELARGTLATLFVCFRKRSGYPYATAEYADTEPMKWGENPDIGRAASEMLRLHTLLRFGASRSNIPFIAAPIAPRHALLANSVPMTYLWGGGEMRAEKMAEDYRNHLISRSDRVSGQLFVIVLMNARNYMDPNELVGRVFEHQIDRGQPLPGSGKHLTPRGDVTTGETWKPFFVYSHSIEDALGQNDVSFAQSKLSQLVQGMVEHEVGA